MKHKGPLVTLLAGLAVALVLLVVNINATGGNKTGDSNGAPAGNTTSVSPTTAPPTVASTTPAAKKQVTYAGKVNGAAATIAIAINGGQAIAYLCDGKKLETWLQGKAEEGKLDLTGTNEGGLTGTYGNGVAAGSISAAGKSFSFRLTAVNPPSGLYRAAADVRTAKVVGGWVVLADGTQIGGLATDGVSGPAPQLDLSKLSTVVDGVTLTAKPVDGSGL